MDPSRHSASGNTWALPRLDTHPQGAAQGRMSASAEHLRCRPAARVDPSGPPSVPATQGMQRERERVRAALAHWSRREGSRRRRPRPAQARLARRASHGSSGTSTPRESGSAMRPRHGLRHSQAAHGRRRDKGTCTPASIAWPHCVPWPAQPRNGLRSDRMPC